MKFTRKFVPALALLIVSAVLMTTATFAWFSMNTRVTATGMQMDTEAGDNVLISDSKNDTKAADATFKSALVMSADVAHLRPVSSVDGANFYYVKNSSVVGGNGATDAPSGYELYAKYDPSAGADFNKAYRVPAGTTIKPYTEYEFQVMATNDGDAAKTLVFDRVDLTYGGSSDVQKAFRAAIFVGDITNGATTETLVTILRHTDAAYYSNSPAQAVNSTTAKGDVNAKLDADAILGSVPADETKYYKVIVRVWLEGEDTTCTNKTFAKLDETWSLDLAISFANTGSTPPVAAVEYLNSAERSHTLVEADGYTVGTEYQVIDATMYYPILKNGQPVVVSGNSYLYTTTTPAAGFASVDNFYALTKDATYGTYHYPINVTPQYTGIDAADLTDATAETGVGDVVIDPTPADPSSGDEVTYYAITGKTLNGAQLYAAAIGDITAASEVYTIAGNAATSVTQYCFLPADLTAATAADEVVLDPTPADPASGDEVTYYAITGKFLKGVQVYADATGAVTATSTIYTIEGGVATDVTVYCTLPTP